MIVDGYLWAVVSLPAGVFNPYSMQKTSILLFDRILAKQTKDILFIKIDNDGFDLGAQRRSIEQNDLPEALEVLREWKKAGKISAGRLPHTVTRKHLLETPDCNLSGERYRATLIPVGGKWPVVRLADVCNFKTGGTPTSTNNSYYEGGTIPWLVSGDIHKGEIYDCERRITAEGIENSNAKVLPNGSVLIALNGQGKTRGTVALLRMANATCNQSVVSLDPKSRKQLLPEFLFYQLRGMYSHIRALTGDNERSGLSISIIKTIQIVLPPLSEQAKIVACLEGDRQQIDKMQKRIAVLENEMRKKVMAIWDE